tara:strand:+ start:5157 stop:5555 length:399 start_codon:yes stop_codon:yes gene_type:complete
MSRFIKKQNLSKIEQTIIVTIEAPFDVNSNFTDAKYQLPIETLSVSKNFSFKENLMDTEFLQSSNIIDKKQFSRIKNSKLELADKFDNENDPFFDLDDKKDIISSTIEDNNALNKVNTKLKNKSTMNRYKIK